MTDATDGRGDARGGDGAGRSTLSDEPPERSNDGARPLRQRFDSLDGLRALAALAVLVTHVGDATALSHRVLHLGGFTFPLNGAVYELNLGVEVFFVISAFLVYRPFLAAHVDGGRHPEPLRFLWRRAWRIYPAYWVALAVIVALTSKSLSFPGGANNGDLRVAHVLLVWGYDLRWIGGNFGLRQAWTLVVEVSFYCFVPVWAWVVRGAGRRFGALRAEIVGALLLLPVSPWMVWNMHPAHTPTPLRVLPPFLTAFAVGMLFAALDVWHERRPASHAAYDKLADHASWAWAGALVVFVVFVKLVGINGLTATTATARQQSAERTMHALVAGLVAFPAMVGVQRRDGVRRILRWRPLVLLGIVSYGFYLWHYLFIDTLRNKLDAWARTGRHTRTVNLFAHHIWFEVGAFFVIALVGATILGALSWYVIERPAIEFAAGRSRWWPALRDRVRARVHRPRFYTGLTAISLAALAGRIGYVLNERGRLTLAGDAFYYHTQANDLAHGRWFIDPSQFAFYGRVTPSAGHPPTYLLYLAGVSKVIGTSELTHRVASTLLGAAAVFFVGVLARMLFDDDRAGWIAAALAAVYAHMWINDEMLMSESMYQLWTVVAVITVYRFWRDPRRSTAAWMGAAIGMAALSRAEATTLFPLIVIPFVIVLRRIALRQRIAARRDHVRDRCAGDGALGALQHGPVRAPRGDVERHRQHADGRELRLHVQAAVSRLLERAVRVELSRVAARRRIREGGRLAQAGPRLHRQPSRPAARDGRVARGADVGRRLHRPEHLPLQRAPRGPRRVAVAHRDVAISALDAARDSWARAPAPAADHDRPVPRDRGHDHGYRGGHVRHHALTARPSTRSLPVLAAGAIIYRLDRSRPRSRAAGAPLVVPSAEPETAVTPA